MRKFTLALAAAILVSVQPSFAEFRPPRITAPAEGQKFVARAAVRVSVFVPKSLGSVRTVRILKNGKVTHTLLHRPFRARWKKLRSGSFTARARVLTMKGKRYSTAAVHFSVGSSFTPVPNIPGDGSHPRIWLTTNDLPHLREWAVATNPVYQSLKKVASDMGDKVEAGEVPGSCVDNNNDNSPDNDWDAGTGLFDSGSRVTEMHAEIFGFMSLVEPDGELKTKHRTWAHDLIMAMANQGALGDYDETAECTSKGHNKNSCFCREKKRFRDWKRVGSSDLDYFLTGDRGFAFDALPAAVDWVYDTFTAQEKAVIRAAFLNWIKGPLTREFGYSPRPVWKLSDPVLLHLDEPKLAQFRFAANNHYLSYMRAIGMMALALDPADDTGAVDSYGYKLRDYTANINNSWMYVTDYNRRNDTPGGLSPEGSMYSDLGLKFEMQYRLGLLTAGLADTDAWGPQVGFFNHAFWDEVVPAYLHSLPPTPVVKESWQGPVYEPAWYGDGQQDWQPDITGFLGMVALYDIENGITSRLPTIRWALKNTAPGGAAAFQTRIQSSYSNVRVRDAIIDFMVFDPGAAEAADPRPSLDKELYASGLGRLLARTGWDSSASFFSYKLSFNRIDHNHGDGNMFDFWRKGQWLTKNRVGYGQRSGHSDFHNTLAVRNYCNVSGGQYNSGAYNYEDWVNGSQFALGAGSQAASNAHSAANWQDSPMDPKILALSKSAGAPLVAVTGDSTILYNHWNEYNSAETCEDVKHVSRSIVWLKASDQIVVYDRAKTTHGGFKRFWLNLAAQPSITVDNSTSSVVAIASSPDGGQKLSVRTLLPASGSVSVTSSNAFPDGGGYDETASGENFLWRLKVEASGDPAEARFLHVLQGYDNGGAADAATLVQTSSGKAFDGAAFNHTVVLFAKDLSQAFSTFSYTAPSGSTTHIITGLTAGGSYTLAKIGNVYTVSSGGPLQADDGGALRAAVP